MERSQESKGDGSMKLITSFIMDVDKVKAIFAIWIVAVVALLLAGCMSEREYMLRKKNAENAAAHPATFDVLTIKGPVNIATGAELTAKAPSQPFQPLPVPDGIEAQRGIVRDVVTGAVIGYGLHQAGHNSTTKTTVTGGAE